MEKLTSPPPLPRGALLAWTKGRHPQALDPSLPRPADHRSASRRAVFSDKWRRVKRMTLYDLGSAAVSYDFQGGWLVRSGLVSQVGCHLKLSFGVGCGEKMNHGTRWPKYRFKAVRIKNFMCFDSALRHTEAYRYRLI